MSKKKPIKFKAFFYEVVVVSIGLKIIDFDFATDGWELGQISQNFRNKYEGKGYKMETKSVDSFEGERDYVLSERSCNE